MQQIPPQPGSGFQTSITLFKGLRFKKKNLFFSKNGKWKRKGGAKRSLSAWTSLNRSCGLLPGPKARDKNWLKSHCWELILLKQLYPGENQGASLELSTVRDQRFCASTRSLAHIFLEAQMSLGRMCYLFLSREDICGSFSLVCFFFFLQGKAPITNFPLSHWHVQDLKGSGPELEDETIMNKMYLC